MEPSLLGQINKEITDYKGKFISLVPGLTYNQDWTLQTIFFYYNSKFKTGEIDEDGDRKYFENIVKNPCKVFSKSIDFDTKNIRLLTTGGGNPGKTWFMERDLKYWMREKQFGKVLNRIFRELPIFGSVVIKIIQGTPYFVDLRNFIVEQSADDLDCSAYITEIHNYTVGEFRKIAKKMKWNDSDIEKVIEEFYKMKDTSHIKVYERYGDVCTEDSDGKHYSYKRAFVADVGVDEYDKASGNLIQHKGVELSSEEWEGHPYWEFHAEKMAGRWLGIGVVETLFEPQIRINELANVQAKTTYWAGLRVFQGADDTMNRNLYSDVKNGEYLANGGNPITQIDMSDRNLAFFNEEHQKWQQNRAELTFSYDVVQGERLPAGTPLGSAQLSISQTLSYFEGIQENVAMDVKEMLYVDIIPSFEKENSQEHILRLVGQDLDQYIDMVKNDLVLKEVIRTAVSGKSFPTNHDRDVMEVAIAASIKQGKEKLLTIPKGFYEDVKYDVDIDITGESVDTRVRSATRFAIIQAITADPTMTTDPVKRKLLIGFAEDGGINSQDFLDVQTKDVGDVAPVPAGRAGGGVSAPALGAKVPGKVAQTV